VQKGLVETGLIFFSHKQKLVLVRIEPLGKFPFPDGLPVRVAVHVRLGVGHVRNIRVFDSAGKGNQRLHVFVTLLLNLAVKLLFIPNGVQSRTRHDHRLRSAADFVPGVRAESGHEQWPRARDSLASPEASPAQTKVIVDAD
jgi:hypothetical protein